LQHCRDADPDEIRDVGVDDPGEAWGAGFYVVGEGELIEGKECPDEGGEDEEDVYGGEEVVLEAKLEIGKGEVENEVEDKRQSHYRRQLLCVDFVKHCSIGNGDDGVQNRPYNSKN